MKKIIYLLLSSFLFLSACNDKIVEEAIKGWWSIDTIYYNGYDIKNCMYSGVIHFKIGENSIFPYSEDNCNEIKNSYDPKGTWQVTKLPNDSVPLRIKITSLNEIFSGTHKIVFYKDYEIKMLKMEMWSDSLYVVLRKGLYNFEKHSKTMDELEQISWPTRPKY